MSRPESVWWRWSVYLIVPVTIVLLWWFTAGEDAESALWRHYSAAVAAFNIACSACIIAAGYVACSRQGVARRLGRVALLAVGVAFTLVMLELPALVLGHDYGQTFGTRTNDTWLQLATRVNRRDDALIHVHQPHTRYRGTVTGNLVWLGIPSPARYDVDVAYDQNGFRNDVDFETADVVAIGDSFVEGAETAQPLTTVAHLARRLGIAVANLGQSNYGPQQELAVLERFGVPLSPKVVIWFLFGGNDLSDVDRYEWQQQHLDELLAPPSWSSRSFPRNALGAIARLTTPARRVASPIARRHAATFVNSAGETETFYLDADEDPWLPRQWEIASTTLLRARDVTRRVGADLLVVYIPRKLRVYRGFLRAEPDAVAHTWTLNNLPDVLGAWCRAHDVAFLDSTLPLRQAVASGTSVYLPDDVHWNAAGHEVVAAAVADRLLGMQSLSPPDTLGSTQ